MSYRRNQKANKQLETNESINIIYKILWQTIKALLREKLISINAYAKKLERYQVNMLTIYLKGVENNSKRY